MGVKEFRFSEYIPERSTWRYQTTIQSDDGVPVVPGDVLSVALTLRDLTSNTIVNSRSAVDVNNANGGSVIAGVFTFQFTQDDTAILGTGNSERRLMTLDFRLSGGGRATHEVYFYVRNFRDIS
jgi:hypothetical protein